MWTWYCFVGIMHKLNTWLLREATGRCLIDPCGKCQNMAGWYALYKGSHILWLYITISNIKFPIWKYIVDMNALVKLVNILMTFINKATRSPEISGGRRSPAVACWASDHWVASSNLLRGKFRHSFRLIIPGICLAQFSLNNVHKRGLKNHHFFHLTNVATFVYTLLR